MKRGQATVELMMVLSVSLVALAIIFSVYQGQLLAGAASQESSTALTTIRHMVDSANSLYLSGAGSRARVLVQLPSSLQMSSSRIVGPALVLRLANGTDISGTADVNFNGSWKQSGGAYVTGGYYATLVFDGNVVNIYYDDFQLSTEGLSFSATQGTTTPAFFSVQNVSGSAATFAVAYSFSHSPFASLSAAPGYDSFSLAPGEIKRIDFNVVLASSASGNYSGAFDINGTVNGVLISKRVSLSIEAFLPIKEIVIYPQSTSPPLSASPGATVRQSYTICNSSANDISGITWQRDSNKDANMLTWFTWPVVDSGGSQITSVSKASCKSFDLNISVPNGASAQMYDANFTVLWPGSNTFTSYIYVSVSVSSITRFAYFFSDANFNAGSPIFNYMKVVGGDLGVAADSNSLLSVYNSTGVDHSGDANFVSGVFDSGSASTTFNSVLFDSNTVLYGREVSPSVEPDYNSNLVALWHFNPSGTFVDSSPNANNLTTVVGVAQATGKLSNGASFDGNSYAFGPNSSGLSFDYDTPFSVSAWVKTTSNSAQMIVEKSDGSTYKGFELFLLSGNIYFYLLNSYPSYGVQVYAAAPSYYNGNWHHIVATYDGSGQASGVKIYMDGNLNSATTRLDTLGSRSVANSQPFNLGRRRSDNLYKFVGSMDELGVWKNRVLSQSDVTALYNGGSGSLISNSDTNLSAVYHMEDTTWTNFADSGSGGNTLSCMGACPSMATGLWDTNAQNFSGSAIGLYKSNSASFKFVKTMGFTWSAWVKPASFPSGWSSILIIGSSNNGDPMNQIGFYNYGGGNISLIFMINKMWVATDGVSVTYTTPSGKWVHIVGVYQDQNTKLYVNGALVGTKLTALNENTTATGGVYIGGDSFGTEPFKGIIEEVADWNRAFSDSEVLQLFSKGAVKFGVEYRSCANSNCSDGNWAPAGDYNYSARTSIPVNSSGRYFQYLVKPSYLSFPYDAYSVCSGSPSNSACSQWDSNQSGCQLFGSHNSQCSYSSGSCSGTADCGAYPPDMSCTFAGGSGVCSILEGGGLGYGYGFGCGEDLGYGYGFGCGGSGVFFQKFDWGSEEDCINDNVCLTRGDDGGLFNSADESGFTWEVSPTYTEWSKGTCADASEFGNWTDYAAPGAYGGPDAMLADSQCMHLTDGSDLYFDVKFHSFTGGGTNGGGFSYTRYSYSENNEYCGVYMGCGILSGSNCTTVSGCSLGSSSCSGTMTCFAQNSASSPSDCTGIGCTWTANSAGVAKMLGAYPVFKDFNLVYTN